MGQCQKDMIAADDRRIGGEEQQIEALMTTASLRPSPPESMATSEMKRSLWVALNSAGSR